MNSMNNYEIPEGFVLLSEGAPDALQELRYATSFNFVGTPIDGYESPRAALTERAANALRRACVLAADQGLRLKVYDADRPQRAVDHFNRWVQDAGDIRMKRWFYPNVDKSELYALNFLGHRSSHSRGSAVDLTLVEMATGREADLGGPFDFFGPRSRYSWPGLTAQQAVNRALLRNLMTRCGFAPLESEWWHFRLIDEPFPDTWFDFVVR